jgi:manganese/zinc/iron transport system permease protein
MIVTTGALVLGVVCGMLGSFALLRQQSLMGDAISHATLPGVVIVYLIFSSKEPWLLMIGALLSGWLALIGIFLMTRYGRFKSDAALGVVLSVFFGFGIMLLTIVGRLPQGSKAGLDKFLFGSAATMLQSDVLMIVILAGLIMMLLLLFWKEFAVLVFDYHYTQSLGFPAKRLDIFLMFLMGACIVIGLQTVGVVLMSALLVAPAAAARQWTSKLSSMVVVAGIIGGLSAAVGALISASVVRLPTGPVIVIVLSSIVLLSLIIAPHRGLLADYWRSMTNRRNIRRGVVLNNLLLFSESTKDPFVAHDISALEAIGRGVALKTMRELQELGYVKEVKVQQWVLTPKGFQQAQRYQSLFMKEGE